MNSDVKLYLKLFLFGAIIFGIGTLFFDFIDGREFRIWGFLFGVLFYGIAMSLLLGSLHIFYIEEIIGVEKITADDLGVKQIRIVKSDINRQELINKLKKDPIIGKMKLALTEDEISLKSNSTWKFLG